jgi:hypothetical protein
VPAPGQAKKIAVLGSLDHVTGELIMDTTALRHVNVPECRTSPTNRGGDFVAHGAARPPAAASTMRRDRLPAFVIHPSSPFTVANVPRFSFPVQSLPSAKFKSLAAHRLRP